MGFQDTRQEILLRKIGKRKNEIRRYLISNITPIKGVVYRETKAFEKIGDALKANNYQPIEVGTWWGGGMNGWFKLCFTIPKEWKGREVAAHLNFGAEACIFIDGKPYHGTDSNHEEVLLTQNANGGEKYEFVVDATSSAPWDPNETRKVCFSRCELATRNPEVREYWFNIEFLHLLAQDLPKDSARRAKIIYLLNKSVDAFDYTHTDDDSLRGSALGANKILKPLLDCKASASAGNVAAHGHSHLDVAYMWPYRETKRKVSRTFSTVMRLMEEYPEYIFTQSQAQLYAYVRDNYPDLYAEIKQRAREGRWEVTGSMWVEADCNLSSGESLVRQVVMGKQFYMDEFGVETDVLWLPDVFGYSAALPQILKKARVPYFSTVKISWNQFNKFPYNTFHWVGIDGSRVLAHFPPTGDYSVYPGIERLRQQVEMHAEKDRCDWSLLSYGWGDGGGGADPRHLESLRRCRNLEGLPKFHQMKVADFFHKIDGTPDLPEWVGELYLEYHRGTLTTQARNKRLNRKAELLYRDAELLSVIAGPMGLPYPRKEMKQQWQEILLHQFHDVIPGSSIRQVYEDTEQMYPPIFEFGEGTVDSALKRLASEIDTTGKGDAIVVINTLPWQRTELVKVKMPEGSAYSVFTEDGIELPCQVSDGALEFAATAPSMGYSTYRLIEKTPSIKISHLVINKYSLENKFYKIALDKQGLIKSIIHKESGREVISQGKRANLLQLYEDKPIKYDAWELDYYYLEKCEDITALESIRVVEEGPVSAGLEIRRRFGESEIRQKMVIYADSPRIDFETWVDWHEYEKCLKVAFPLDVNSPTARYEIQFGNVERPTHSNTSWDFAKFEVCAHKWADMSEGGFGMSLMNDCKYGHRTAGNVMQMTLLRAPKFPDREADMGEHVFTYSIMPHSGNYAEAGTVKQAYNLNVPMRAAVAKPSKGDLPKEKSFFRVDADNVVLETVKAAEKEDATILRFYECHNTRSKVTVKVDVPFRKIHECDLMEDNIVGVSFKNGEFSFEIKPFEIKTFKLA